MELTILHSVLAFSAAFAIGIGCLGAAIGQGRAVGSACESIARQPELLGELRMVMIMGLAFIESLAIYCLLVSLALLFVRW